MTRTIVDFSRQCPHGCNHEGNALTATVYYRDGGFRVCARHASIYRANVGAPINVVND